MHQGEAPGGNDRWTPVYAAFVQHAWNPETDRFRNFMAFDRTWLEEAGSDDSSARALWSLGVAARDGRNAELRDWAAALFGRTGDHAVQFTFPRSRAFAILGATALAEIRPGDPLANRILTLHGEALGHDLDTDTVQRNLDDLTGKVTGDLPLGIHIDSSQVTDSGVVVKFSTRDAAIPSSSSSSNGCFDSL